MDFKMQIASVFMSIITFTGVYCQNLDEQYSKTVIEFYKQLDEGKPEKAIELFNPKVVKRHDITTAFLNELWIKSKGRPANAANPDTISLIPLENGNYLVYLIYYNDANSLKTSIDSKGQILGFFLVAKEEAFVSIHEREKLKEISSMLYAELYQGNYDKVVDLMDSSLMKKKGVTINDIQRDWEKNSKKTGKFIHTVETYFEMDESNEPAIHHLFHCEKGDFAYTTYFNTKDEVIGFQNIPTWLLTQIFQPNSIREVKNRTIIKWIFTGGKNIQEDDVPDGVKETKFILQSGKYNLPAKLTRPKKGRNFPVVILVHGSGPSDMDGSTGSYSPFRDIAYFLAENGIACLRYDKRSFVYGGDISEDSLITFKDEVIDDVKSAILYCSEYRKIDDESIFVLGHSLGGILTPKILQQCRGVKGAIIMAGVQVNPFIDEMERQINFILSTEDSISSDEVNELNTILEKISEIKNINSENINVGNYILGAPEEYWHELNNYKPLEEVKKLELPILFVQGERDYQVTYEDFKIWKNELSQQSNFKFISYPNLNHYFVHGEGEPNRKEYFQEGHVSDKVLSDIVKFINDSK